MAFEQKPYAEGKKKNTSWKICHLIFYSKSGFKKENIVITNNIL